MRLNKLGPLSIKGSSARVAQEIIDMKYPNVYALKGGWVEWEKSGHPTEKK